MVEWVEYAKFFAGLVSIVNPIGSIPIFINLTANQSPVQRHRTGFLASVSVALVLGIVLVAGEALRVKSFISLITLFLLPRIKGI